VPPAPPTYPAAPVLLHPLATTAQTSALFISVSASVLPDMSSPPFFSPAHQTATLIHPASPVSECRTNPKRKRGNFRRFSRAYASGSCGAAKRKRLHPSFPRRRQSVGCCRCNKNGPAAGTPSNPNRGPVWIPASQPALQVPNSLVM
jgi:hypothetical protein